MTERYQDIIACSRPVSRRHLPMSRADRAAQFSPFAALTGYDGVIAETARLTDRQVELDEDEKAALNVKLREIQENLQQHPTVTLTYFQADGSKAGGAYLTVTGQVKRLDPVSRTLTFLDGTVVDIQQIYCIY